MYIDTDIIYALIKAEDPHKTFALRISKTQERKYASVLLLVELELVIKKEIGDLESKEVLHLIEELPFSLELKPVDKMTMEKSLELRKIHNLGIFDSIHAACAFLDDKKIASTDKVYDRISELQRVR